MNLVFLTHPEFFPSASMSRFAKLLVTGMKAKGHSVTSWSPMAKFFTIPIPKLNRKWLGYIDQYILFPRDVKKKLKTCPPDTLFVLVDNALGPWLPLVADRPHIMHCHDFLALRSALGEISENPTSRTGKQYQKYIQIGYQKGKHFISDSYKTRQDLHRFLKHKPLTSDMVYIGLNPLFHPYDPHKARYILSDLTKLNLSDGYLLHVGGNQWYKNRIGVVELYDVLCEKYACKLPLILIGYPPSPDLKAKYHLSAFQDNIHFLTNVNDETVYMAYAGASLFLFPSLAEGFGWPIAEAMASGCPVVTTNEAPMTEVAGNAGFFIPRRPSNEQNIEAWAIESAEVVNKVIQFSSKERRVAVAAGLDNVKRFETIEYLDKIEAVYLEILRNSKKES